MRCINWNKYKYNETQLREAVKQHISARSAMLSLGLCSSGAGYKPFMRIIKILNINTTHWLGKGSLKGKTHNWNKKPDLRLVLKKNSSYTQSSLRRRIKNEKLIPEMCNLCGIKNQWNGKILNLHLDHINGVSNDHRIGNLRYLCPNCHSQTDTYAGKNKGKSGVV
jgi:hypothetical protein